MHVLFSALLERLDLQKGILGVCLRKRLEISASWLVHTDPCLITMLGEEESTKYD